MKRNFNLNNVSTLQSVVTDGQLSRANPRSDIIVVTVSDLGKIDAADCHDDFTTIIERCRTVQTNHDGDLEFYFRRPCDSPELPDCSAGKDAGYTLRYGSVDEIKVDQLIKDCSLLCASAQCDAYDLINRLINEQRAPQVRELRSLTLSDLGDLLDSLADWGSEDEADDGDWYPTEPYAIAAKVCYAAAAALREREPTYQAAFAKFEVDTRATAATRSAKQKASSLDSSNSPSAETKSAEPQRLLRVVRVGDLENAKIAPPQFIVDKIIPRRVVTLLGGHGGVGKSTLAKTIAAHAASASSEAWPTFWSGFETKPGRVVFVSLEDEAELVRYRLRNIADAYQLNHARLDQNFLIIDGTDLHDGLAFEGRGRHSLEFSRAMAELEGGANGAQLIVVDNASDAFAGDENNRSQVKQFIRRLTSGLARANDAGLILLAHIDKGAARNGSAGNSYSGSTAWHNSARSRLALVDTDGVIELRHEKSNFGPKAPTIQLQMSEHGVLTPVATDSAGVVSVDDALFRCIKVATDRGESVSTSRNGPGNTHSHLRTMATFPAALRPSAKFWQALDRLADAGKITRETFKDSNRRTKEKWAIAQVRK